MHLILDFGNTLIKCFVFDAQELVFQEHVQINDWQKNIRKHLVDFPKIDALIISDVRGITSEKDQQFFNGLQVYYCNSKLKIPFSNHYKTPESLGADRIALVAAATLLYPNQDVLIIDLGSCITYDFKDTANNYYGGAISPGFKMRYKSLHTNTGKLPSLESKTPTHWIGDTTENAIHSGVYFGILSEIQGQIAHYTEKCENLTVIFVGGDAQRLPKPFKNGIFAHSNFLAKGLNYILELNKSSC